MKSGIYRIVNKVNGHCYIGSTHNLNHRWSIHKYKLRNNNHHSIILQRAWNKYGENNFFIELIDTVEPDSLLSKETEWIKKLKPEYNVGSVGGGDNISNHPNLDKIRKKHSINGKKRWENMSEEEYQSICESKRGNKNPNWKGGVSSNNICQECKKPIQYSHQHCTHCSKVGAKNPFFGKTHSKDVLKRLSESRKGRKPSNSNQITINGITYLSQADAAKALNVSIGTITNWKTGRIHKKDIIIQQPQTLV